MVRQASTTLLILIVSDDGDLQRSVSATLLADGFACRVLGEAPRLVEVAGNETPDLVLLDADIEGFDGRDLLGALKRDPRTAMIPVFVVTGQNRHWGRLAAFELGADEYLEKPLFLSGLGRRILWRLAKGTTDVPRVTSQRPVLIVEDDEDVRESLSQILEDEGIATVAAKNGKEALDMLHDERVSPSLILLDLMMPVMDGWEFRKRMDADVSIVPPVIVMSARPRDDSVRSVAWLQKPLHVDVLLSAIQKYAAA